MVTVFAFVLGLIIGSFISALSWRYPRNISIAKGRSICPHCKKTIAWFDNIPLFSYFLLGGKCRSCHKHISLRYPFIELATGLGFAYIWLSHMAAPFVLAFYLLTYSLLLLIFVVDFENQIIPDIFVFFGVAVVFLFSLFSIPYSVYFSLSSGFLAASLLMLIHLATFGRGMGLGDVKFAILGGMIVGLKFMPIWLLVSFLTGGFTGFILILTRRARLKTKIAFGPFLIVGLFVTLVYGNQILSLLGF